MNGIKIQKIKYKGWENCIHMSNGSIELIITTDVGPRIIYFGFVGQQNELFELEEESGKTGGDQFRFYGGHRLWAAPQDARRTEEVDNTSVNYVQKNNSIYLYPEMNPWAQIKKEIEVTMLPNCDKVLLHHRIINKNAWEIELALWSLTLVAPGGVETIPMSTTDSLFEPNRTIALWKWSKMNDPKMVWGEKYILGKQFNISGMTRGAVPANEDDPCGCWSNAIKLGVNNDQGWAAVSNHNNLFVFRFNHIKGARYTDKNSSYETFICDYMTEVETLSPLYKLKPEESAEHIETWELYKDIKKPENEDEVDQFILPLIKNNK